MDANRMLSWIEAHVEHSSQTDLGLNLMVYAVGLTFGLVDILRTDNPDQVKVRKDLRDARIALEVAASKLEDTEILEQVQRYSRLVAELTNLAA
jgi:hypothetical protein